MNVVSKQTYYTQEKNSALPAWYTILNEIFCSEPREICPFRWLNRMNELKIQILKGFFLHIGSKHAIQSGFCLSLSLFLFSLIYSKYIWILEEEYIIWFLAILEDMWCHLFIYYSCILGTSYACGKWLLCCYSKDYRYPISFIFYWTSLSCWRTACHYSCYWVSACWKVCEIQVLAYSVWT